MCKMEVINRCEERTGACIPNEERRKGALRSAYIINRCEERTTPAPCVRPDGVAVEAGALVEHEVDLVALAQPVVVAVQVPAG